MKRFWSKVTVEPADGWTIKLDDRLVRTPGRALLDVPTQDLAEAIAEEWRSVGEEIEPPAMPLTGLANAAIDRVSPDRDTFAALVSRYAEADLACYRSDGPRELVERQAERWDQLLVWARRRYDVDFVVTSGIIHVPQPQATVDRLTQAVAEVDSFRLAGLLSLVTIGGSLVAALGVLEKAISASEAWDDVSIDERWQLERWGADAEAQAALARREHDFLAAGRFLELLEG